MADVPIRASTIKLMELADEGILTWEQIGRACLVYMSEDDVSDMARENELFWAEVEDGDEEPDYEETSFDYDGDALASAGWGTDEDY